jgi:hypothetical protein
VWFFHYFFLSLFLLFLLSYFLPPIFLSFYYKTFRLPCLLIFLLFLFLDVSIISVFSNLFHLSFFFFPSSRLSSFISLSISSCSIPLLRRYIPPTLSKRTCCFSDLAVREEHGIVAVIAKRVIHNIYL